MMAREIGHRFCVTLFTVFSGQASTHELERALRDLDARLTRDFVSGDA